jgi:N4-(beta-N-acetylglucosaminyl)-L-asparaginase
VSEKINRREFLIGGVATVAAATVAETQSNQSPTIITKKGISPIVISSSNGNFFKNGGNMTCVETAFTKMTQGVDVLDALIAGVNIVELDPEDYSVGYGGMPNADGVVQLDPHACMVRKNRPEQLLQLKV